MMRLDLEDADGTKSTITGRAANPVESSMLP